ncbi:Heavy metal-associated domain superfamily [Sesbania bispinosa]|nr:Heavy metal-associated domain superfamily [Sesbania bispinosa]
MNCILRVDTQSSRWEKAVTKVIKRVKDVSYSIDTTYGVIRISGQIDPNKLLTDIKKVGKHVELIHADCGGGGAYGYDYDGAYAYPYYVANQGLSYIQYYPLQFNGLSGQSHAPHPPPSAPPLNYDPYNPSCYIM